MSFSSLGVLGYAEGQPERLPGLAAELLELGVRVIVAGGNTGTLAARQATDRVPIVSVNGLADPVAQGFVASLARPGGNLTGVVSAGGTYAKSAELLAEAVPTGRRLAYLGNVSTSTSPHGEVTGAAADFGLDVLVMDVPTQDRLEPAFEQAVAWGADLLTAQSVIPLNVNPNQLPSLALRARLPAASSASGRPWVEAGFLLHTEATVRPRLTVRRGTWRASWPAPTRATAL